MVTHNVDVVIVGAGIVGAALAVSLRQSGLALALVEPNPPALSLQEAADAAPWDSRIYAFSPGSARLLAQLGAWQQLDATRLGAVHAMDVRGDQGARLVLDAYEAGVPELAWIAESSQIQNALWRVMQQQDNLQIHSGVTGISLGWTGEQSRLELSDGSVINASLVVAADGRPSWVRQQARLEARRSDYHQSGVVANFVCEHAHRQIARQWFRQDGILAWLPLPDNVVSMVWSTDATHTAELLALPAAELAERVAAAGEHALGDMRVVTPAAAFPLSILRVPVTVAPGLALIGDAAHGVHPLSGQGVNLGLRDVAALSAVLLARGEAGCGELTLLKRFERARRGDVLAMQAVTDTLHKLFRTQNPWVAAMRNMGMDLLQRIEPLKSRMIRQALI